VEQKLLTLPGHPSSPYPTVLVLNQSISIRRVKIPKGYQNPYIEEEQTAQWPKEKDITRLLMHI
jgi:hypothetical protein